MDETLYGIILIENGTIEYTYPLSLLEKSKINTYLDFDQGVHLISQDKIVHVYKISSSKKLYIIGNSKYITSLIQDQRNFEYIFEHSFDGIYVTDGKGTTLHVNPGSERNYGVNASGLIGRNIYDLEREGIFKPSVARQVIETRRQVTIEQKTKNGKNVLATGNPIFNKKGDLIQVICNSRDMTEVTNLKKKLQEYEKWINVSDDLHNPVQKRAFKHGIVAQSDSMRNIMSIVEQVAPYKTNVLITGESGTGKGAIAKALHQESEGSSAPFIQVNCGAIPEQLIEAELFGYEPFKIKKSRRLEVVTKSRLIAE
jgi:PAS domain S-box-containing protein